jgi:hypothetical protein
MNFSHTRLFPHHSGSMLSPSNVFVPKVSGTQSDATYDYPEQDIIETHNHYSRAIYTAGKRGWSARRSHGQRPATTGYVRGRPRVNNT